MPSLPEPTRIYAIGDVHGCLDRLRTLHRLVARDLERAPVGRSVLIHLGDLIDRGPDSAGVVALLAAGEVPPVTARVDLSGNHEAMLLAALDGKRGAAGDWLENGGVAAAKSWGIPAKLSPAHWASVIPAADLVFLRGLRTHYREGGYVFAHAGIRPGIALERQDPHDLMWIREPFLSDPEPRDFVVVHGHTIKRRPVIRANRIGIDTGAVIGGDLTCVVLQGDDRRFLTA